MRAAVLYPNGDIDIEEREAPEPGEREVLVEVKACGVCKTDLHIARGSFNPPGPVVLGHEFSGVVRERGSGVEDFRPGDRVAVNPINSCGDCRYCAQGRTNLCSDAVVLGGAGEEIVDGGFQELSLVPAASLGKIDAEVPFLRGAFAEPLGCAVRGIERAQIGLGDDVLIIGAGPMGLLLLQLACLEGAGRIWMSELRAKRRELARELGADRVLDPGKESLEELIEAEGPEGGFDVAIEAVGAEETFEVALNSTRRGGRAMVFGVPPEDARVPLDIFSTYYDEIDVIGSYAISKDSFYRSLSLLDGGRIRTEELISHELELDQLPEALRLAEEGEGMKKVIVFD